MQCIYVCIICPLLALFLICSLIIYLCPHLPQVREDITGFGMDHIVVGISIGIGMTGCTHYIFLDSVGGVYLLKLTQLPSPIQPLVRGFTISLTALFFCSAVYCFAIS